VKFKYERQAQNSRGVDRLAPLKALYKE